MIKSLTPIAELKYVDASFASYQPTYSFGAISGITMPSAGTSRSSRVGDVVRWKRMEVHGQFYGAVSHICRMIVFLWKPTTTPTGDLILDSQYAGTFRAPFAPYNLNEKQNYQILSDKFLKISATGEQNDIFKLDLNLKAVAKFQSSSSTGTFKPYFFFVQDGVVTLGTIDMTVKLYFTDE